MFLECSNREYLADNITIIVIATVNDVEFIIFHFARCEFRAPHTSLSKVSPFLIPSYICGHSQIHQVVLYEVYFN